MQGQRSPDREAMQHEETLGLSLCQLPQVHKARQLHYFALCQDSYILLCWLPISSSGVSAQH